MPAYFQENQRKLLLFFLKCVIMMVVMSLFLFFIGFAAIVLLHFLFISNTFNRRCNRFFQPVNAVSTELVSEPDIDALVYMGSNFPEKSDCAICLDCFREGDSCRKIPVCKHLFHAKCVDRWIRKKPTCPVCRTPVDLDPPGNNAADRWKRLWAVNFESN